MGGTPKGLPRPTAGLLAVLKMLSALGPGGAVRVADIAAATDMALGADAPVIRFPAPGWAPLPGSTASRAMKALAGLAPGAMVEGIHLAEAIGLDSARDVEGALVPAVLAGHVWTCPSRRDVRRKAYGLVVVSVTAPQEAAAS